MRCYGLRAMSLERRVIGGFRLAIDRAFSVAGAGIVVTGYSAVGLRWRSVTR
jgi:selenocysteine-specific translation elongation factor